MIKKRSAFLTFCFSMLPGAGHMYNGFMKRGLTLMTMFFASFALGGIFAFSVLTWVAPIIWFYSFFDCINLRFQDNEDFYMQEDHYLFDMDKIRRFWISDSKMKFWIGVGLIALGCYTLIYNILLPTLVTSGFLPEQVQRAIYSFLNMIPRLVAAGIVIVVGIVLIRGKKRDLSLDEETDSTEMTSDFGFRQNDTEPQFEQRGTEGGDM